MTIYCIIGRSTNCNNLVIDGVGKDAFEDFKPNISVTVPSSSAGASGDMPGQIAVDEDYIYYCYRKQARTADLTVTVHENANGNGFSTTIDYENFPTDIYDGFTVYNSTAKTTSIGQIQSVSNVDGKARIYYSGSDSHTAGTEYVISNLGGIKHWKRASLSTY